MTEIKRISGLTTFILCFFILLFSCSTVPILKVTYRVPPRPEKPINKEVYLVVEDNRPGKDMIGGGARNDFEHFTGILLLYLSEGGGVTKLGAYDVKSMFYQAFEKRLVRSGLNVGRPDRAHQTGLVIKLNKLLLDLVDRKWVLTIGYKAVLMKQGQVLFSQTVNGNAERLKILGLDQADRVMSDLISDMVNRPDLAEMFKKIDLPSE